MGTPRNLSTPDLAKTLLILMANGLRDCETGVNRFDVEALFVRHFRCLGLSELQARMMFERAWRLAIRSGYVEWFRAGNWGIYWITSSGKAVASG